MKVVQVSLSLGALAVAVLLSGCGLQNQINNLKDDRDYHQIEIDAISERVNMLEMQANMTVESMLNLQQDIAGQSAEIQALQAALATNEAQDQQTRDTLNSAIGAGIAAYNSLVSTQNALQAQVNSALAQIAILQTNQSVVGLVDPCGKSQYAYDEVLFRMADGKLVAFFEQGNNRFMTVLSAGSYMTTDQSHCTFTVTSSNQLTNQHY